MYWKCKSHHDLHLYPSDHEDIGGGDVSRTLSVQLKFLKRHGGVKRKQINEKHMLNKIVYNMHNIYLYMVIFVI